MVSRFVTQHRQEWYILAEYDWYVHVRVLTDAPICVLPEGLQTIPYV